MEQPVELLPGAVYEMFAAVSSSGVLTIADRYGLLAATLDENLSEDERLTVNRLLRSVQRGYVQVAGLPVTEPLGSSS